MNAEKQARREQAIRGYIAGLPLKEIARRANVTYSCVSWWAKQAGVPRRVRGCRPFTEIMKRCLAAHSRGEPVKVTAAREGISPSTISCWVTRNGLPHNKRGPKRTEEMRARIETIKSMRRFGLTLEKIARKYGLSRERIRQITKGVQKGAQIS